MKELILAAVTCYNYGANITQCDNGVTAYQYGNQTQIVGPSNDRATVYEFGNQYQINNGMPTQIAPIPQPPAIAPIQPSFGTLKPFD